MCCSFMSVGTSCGIHITCMCNTNCFYQVFIYYIQCAGQFTIYCHKSSDKYWVALRLHRKFVRSQFNSELFTLRIYSFSLNDIRATSFRKRVFIKISSNWGIIFILMPKIIITKQAQITCKLSQFSGLRKVYY